MAQHPLYSVTHIGRPVDPAYPTNLAILVLMPAIGGIAAALAYHGGADWSSMFAAFALGGLTVFLTWALGRELAPDDNPAAFLAVIAVSPAIFWGLSLDLVLTGLMIGLTRVVNRTVGPPPKPGDVAALLLAVLAVSILRGDWLLPLLAAGAFGLAGALRDPDPHGRPAAAVCVVAAIALLSRTFEPAGCTCPCDPILWIAGGCALLFAIVIVAQPAPRSEADLQPRTLSRRRVQGGMLVALAAAGLTLRGGAAGVLSAAPLWAAMIGVVLGRALPRRAA
ncbi:MAG: hypothetical protein KC636_10850 [Myxococcales bacterium]|nr:hypothetical protein [Myxococcales bacterium]